MAKDKIALTSNMKEFAESMEVTIRQAAIPNRQKLFRIGNLVRNSAVDNLTDSGAVDSGRLRASVSFVIEEGPQISRVVVGAFGIKYARMIEFGGPFTPLMRRAMFASFSEKGGAPRGGKGIIGGGWFQARPFLGPAVRDNFSEIIDILLETPR